LNRTHSAPTIQCVTVRRVLLNPLWMLLLLPAYVGWRLLSALSVGPTGVGGGLVLLIALCVVIPISVRSHPIRNPTLKDLLAWVEEVAALICWIASEECSFTTAAVFDVSGGRATY